MATYFEIQGVYFLCVLGLFLNALQFFKGFSVRAKTKPSPEELSEPNSTEKNRIMEDLDREANRRRKVEQFNKN